jgi:iron complex transport system ATP-binding protein
MLDTENISYSVSGKVLLRPSSLHFDSEKFHVIMGANGAGKSTLLKLMAGELVPYGGKVMFQNRNLKTIPKKELATRRAVMSQHYNIGFPIRVKEMVMMGRYPFFHSKPSVKDHVICEKAMDIMNVAEFTERDYNTLSGGEGQKVQMSRALAQIWEANECNRKILFLDEPVSHLDIKYQYQLLQVAKDLTRQNTTVIAILHDINLSLSFADRIIFLKKGNVKYDIQDINELSHEIIGDVFEVNCKIVQPEGHKAVVVVYNETI